MAYTKVCDECGRPATFGIYGMTGRVLVDGIDNNLQAVDLCDYHKPTEDYPHQANNCKRVVLFWGDGKGGNMYPPKLNKEVGEFLPPTPQEQIEYLENEITRLCESLPKHVQDSILLDYLNDLPDIPPGYGWKLYKSTTGRGWRLATISPLIVKNLSLSPGVYSTPREAIRAEINFEIQSEEKETEG